MSEAAFQLLNVLSDPVCTYARPRKTLARDELKRLGYIESYRPLLRHFGGHGACWRITPAGRAVLAQSVEKK